MKALKVQVTRVDDQDLFLPPQSLIEAYSLLVEHVYAAGAQPAFQAPRRGSFGPGLLVRDYRAYRKLRQVDRELQDLAFRIYEFLNSR